MSEWLYWKLTRLWDRLGWLGFSMDSVLRRFIDWLRDITYPYND